MRIAVYGWVGKDAGSVASANYVLLEALLDRGNEIVLFAKRGHVDAPALRRYQNYRQESAGAGNALFVVRPFLRRSYLLETLYNRMRDPMNSILVSAAVRKQHRSRPFDAILFLGVARKFAIGSLPTISWPQGAPGVEADAFLALRPFVRQYSDPLRYYALCAYHLLRQFQARRLPRTPAPLICPSKWAANVYLSYGFPAESLYVIPQPVDVDTLRPPAQLPIPDEPEFLHIGRLDPRKRLDLLLAAFKLVQTVHPAARLTIVGRAGYTPGVLRLVHQFRQTVAYRPAVPRDEVIRLLQGTAVLVQTSQNETFGSAVAEALSCGMTAVLGRCNGTAEYLDSYSTVFPDYSAEAVASAMLEAWRRRRQDTQAAVNAAREAAVRQFSPTVVAQKLEEVLSSLARPA